MCGACVTPCGAQVAGVTEIPEEELKAFVADISASAAASLPGVSAAAGTTLLGRGGYAAVYRATLRAASTAGAAGEAIALKVAAPSAPWEFAAVRALVSRVPQRYSALFMPARCILLSREAAGSERGSSRVRRMALAPKGEDGGGGVSVLAMPLGTHGTLLDLINAHKTMGRELGAALVVYLSLQLVLVRPTGRRASWSCRPGKYTAICSIYRMVMRCATTPASLAPLLACVRSAPALLCVCR